MGTKTVTEVRCDWCGREMKERTDYHPTYEAEPASGASRRAVKVTLFVASTDDMCQHCQANALADLYYRLKEDA